MSWAFLYTMAESDGYDQHVWDYYFYMEIAAAFRRAR